MAEIKVGRSATPGIKAGSPLKTGIKAEIPSATGIRAEIPPTAWVKLENAREAGIKGGVPVRDRNKGGEIPPPKLNQSSVPIWLADGPIFAHGMCIQYHALWAANMPMPIWYPLVGACNVFA